MESNQKIAYNIGFMRSGEAIWVEWKELRSGDCNATA